MKIKKRERKRNVMVTKIFTELLQQILSSRLLVVIGYYWYTKIKNVILVVGSSQND